MNQTDSTLDSTGSRRMRPAQTWGWPLVARGSRGSQRERICRIATRRDAIPKKQQTAKPGPRYWADLVLSIPLSKDFLEGRALIQGVAVIEKPDIFRRVDTDFLC
jgi:hypothetical protein